MTYSPVSSLKVYYADFLVGQLALKNRRVWFQYDTDFLKKGLQLSPFKLPLRSEVISCEDFIFEGLFGLFNDSLPDGWGRLLLDRHVRSLGIASENLTVLDRLAYVGESAVGALIYKPDYQQSNSFNKNLDLNRLAKESRDVLAGEGADVIQKLIALGGSPAGARPKVLVGVSESKKQVIHGEGRLSEKYEHWIIKFNSGVDPVDSGYIEYAYSLMARASGVRVPQTYLFQGSKGSAYFGVRRFDRDKNKRIHVHTVSGLLHADHRMPSLDYEGILKATMILTRSLLEVEAFFRLAVFNVFSMNRDDHAKNFAFLMDENGTWSAAPAYDLTFSSGPGGEHSTTVLGEGGNPDRTHLLALGKKMNLKHAEQILDEVQAAVLRWREFAEIAGVSRSSRQLIESSLRNRIK